MRYTFLPIKDSSIYEEFPWKNTGHDEIIEIGKSAVGTKSVRSLIQFDTNAISSSISDGTISSGSTFELRLFIARADDLQINQSIELNEVSRSWVEGSGYFYQNVNVPYTASRDVTVGYTEHDGVTWQNRQSGSLWSITGSEYFISPTISGSTLDPITDMKFDITTMVLSWISGTVPNNGVLLKFPTSDEDDNRNAGIVRFFSRQTHTIYAPTLVAKSNNQIYITGSLSLANTAQTLVSPRNLLPKYQSNEMVRVDFSVRDRYPLKTFNTVFSNYAGNQRLPQTSYYSIVDVQSNTTIVPFEDSTRINCDGSGSYADFRIQGMYPGRYYKIKVKVMDTAYTRVFDLGNHFTIEQN